MKRTVIIILLAIIGGFIFNVSAQSVSSGRSRRSAKVQLTVTANVPADVIVKLKTGKGSSSAESVTGITPFTLNLTPGKYSIKASATGYLPQTKVIEIKKDITVDFQLKPATALLDITANVNRARVRITPNGGSSPVIAGTTQFKKKLTLGRYTVTVSAAGYISQKMEINLKKDTNLHFNLKPATGTVRIIIPPGSLNKSDIHARDKIRIIDNGTAVKGTSLQLRPGQHTIQIISGGLWSQITIRVEAGKTYTIKPVLTLTVQ